MLLIAENLGTRTESQALPRVCGNVPFVHLGGAAGAAVECRRALQITELRQSNISNHLACLRDCGLVTNEQRGRYTYYRLTDDRIDGLLRMAEEVLSDVANGVYQCTRYERPTES